ncbi:3780_t:CDS:2 [Diversispora eburnea]|uniref:3780_t:CDS:1 n=1 Tax=Diversispora eburnea TaxID=1213867 RepID=A0A9N9CVZ4_9GLOM|nr:3780_t:CDS:2 [Diversispora eburnea]
MELQLSETQRARLLELYQIDLDLKLYDKGDILSLISVAIDTVKTNEQRLFAYLKSWSLLSKDLVERQLTIKQLRQEVQQITD